MSGVSLADLAGIVRMCQTNFTIVRKYTTSMPVNCKASGKVADADCRITLALSEALPHGLHIYTATVQHVD